MPRPGSTCDDKAVYSGLPSTCVPMPFSISCGSPTRRPRNCT